MSFNIISPFPDVNIWITLTGYPWTFPRLSCCSISYNSSTLKMTSLKQDVVNFYLFSSPPVLTKMHRHTTRKQNKIVTKPLPIKPTSFIINHPHLKRPLLCTYVSHITFTRYIMYFYEFDYWLQLLYYSYFSWLFDKNNRRRSSERVFGAMFCAVTLGYAEVNDIFWTNN